VCAKVRDLQYKVRRLQYKISEITDICRGCTLPANACKYPANACNFLPIYCFFVSSVHLPVEAGYGGSFSVASNVFVITNRTFACRNKNNAPLWMGHPRCQGAWFLPALRLYRLLTLLLLLWRLLWQHRHQLPQLSHRTWVAIARIARSLVNQPSLSC
jgi:hypothetical protein